MRQRASTSSGGGGGWIALASAADQGLASLGNILIVIVVARPSTVDDFAQFMVAYVIYALALGILSSFVGQPLVLVTDEGTDGTDEVSRATARALGAGLLGSLGAGALLAAVAWVIDSPPLIALGAVLFLLLGQETCRFGFAVRRQPHVALLTDAVKVAAVIGTLAVVAPSDPSIAILLWGAAVVPALVLALVLLRIWPDVRGTVTMLRRGYLGRRFVVEFLVGNGSSQLTVLGLGAFGTPTVVAGLRGATTLLGPLNTLYNAATSFAPPFLTRRPPRDRVRRAAVIGCALAAAAIVWAGSLVLLPTAAGESVLGASWELAASVLPAGGVQYVAAAFSTAALLALRTVAPRTTLPLQIIFSGVTVMTTVGGFLVGGLQGAAWGMAIGSTLKCGALWWRVRTLG